MKWYWKVRIYAPNGSYIITQIATNRTLDEINCIQDFYFELTGCKMLLEGMSETDSVELISINEAFHRLLGHPIHV